MFIAFFPYAPVCWRSSSLSGDMLLEWFLTGPLVPRTLDDLNIAALACARW